MATFWISCSHRFPLFWHHFFGKRFRIDLGKDLISCLMFFFYTFSVRARNLPNLKKTFAFTMNLKEFTIQTSMNLNGFHDIFQYLFWQCFLKCFGIDVLPFWHYFVINVGVVGCSCFIILIAFDIFLEILRTKMKPMNRYVGSGACDFPSKSSFGAAIVPRTLFH